MVAGVVIDGGREKDENEISEKKKTKGGGGDGTGKTALRDSPPLALRKCDRWAARSDAFASCL
jgi:hypothetical protein